MNQITSPTTTDESVNSLFVKLTQDFKLRGVEQLFALELTEQYNEDYKHEVTGILIKHSKHEDFCIFAASLNDAEMRRPIDSDKTYKSVVTGIWTPHLEPEFQQEWINEYEFWADEVFEVQEDAIKHISTFINDRLDSIK
jgi:hypothetical protein